MIVSLIAATTTRTGLVVYARLDERDYPKGIKISKYPGPWPAMRAA